MRKITESSTQLTEDKQWQANQEYELGFWRNQWPYRNQTREEILAIRRKDAEWFLASFGFHKTGPDNFAGFTGRVLEVGCGPVGFFENIKDASVLAIDSLMRAYSSHLTFSRLGTVNNYEYSPCALSTIDGYFDFVVCSNVLDHTANWREFLTHLTQPVRRKGGRLLLFSHCRSIPTEGHTQLFDPPELLRHILNSNVVSVPFMRCEPDDTGHGDYKIYICGLY